MTNKIAVIRIRGQVRIPTVVKSTLEMLRLYNTNFCVLIEPTVVNMGMIKKVKDFITYGEVNEDMLTELISKRGQEFKGNLNHKKKYYEIDGKKYCKYFRLHPARGGLKSIKKPYPHGSLGNRRDKIVDLLKRMI